MADIQITHCKNQQKTSSNRGNIVPFKEIGVKESNGDVKIPKYVNGSNGMISFLKFTYSAYILSFWNLATDANSIILCIVVCRRILVNVIYYVNFKYLDDFDFYTNIYI